CVLVVARDRWTVMRQCHAHAPPPDDLRVGEMAQHVVDRPLSRRFTLRELWLRQSERDGSEARFRLLQNLERSYVTDETKYGGGVGLRLFLRWSGGVGED